MCDIGIDLFLSVDLLDRVILQVALAKAKKNDDVEPLDWVLRGNRQTWVMDVPAPY